VVEAGKLAMKTLRAGASANGGEPAGGFSGGAGDRYSPWLALGTFRLSENAR